MDGVELERQDQVAELAGWIADGGVVVLSGAGLSTESGIPDYRGPSGAARRVTPMTYQAFTRDPVARRRYWARSHLGWRTIGDARPNAGHRAVARLQELSALDGIITQNVDGLHQAGGAADVVELHGNLARIACLDCGSLSPRAELADRLNAANPRSRRPRARSTRTATWSSTIASWTVSWWWTARPAAGC